MSNTSKSLQHVLLIYLLVVFMCVAGIGNAKTPLPNADAVFSENDCQPTLPYGFAATDNCYAVWTYGEMTAGKGDYAKVHRLYCYYENEKTGGKANCELHLFELSEEKVKEIFTRGEKDECNSVIPGWMGGWSKTLESTEDRSVILCGRPELNPEFHEMVGNIRYRNSVINIRVESQGSEDVVKSFFAALEENAKRVIDGKSCQDWCSKVNEHFVWDGKSEWPECGCICEKGYGKNDDECVKCEDWCQKMDTRAHYDSKESNPDECKCNCTGKLLEFVWDVDNGTCECVTGAVPNGSECECPEGWNLSVWGDKCIKEEKEVVEKTSIEVERERIAKQYPGLKKGYLLFSEGIVTTAYVRWVSGTVFKPDYGHVGIYIGDFEANKSYKVMDQAQLPLKVFRNGEAFMLTEVGHYIEPGDWIIGCVVESRWNGIVFNTVDGMKNEARRTMGKGEPEFDWKTTNPPPHEDEVDEIITFALQKIDLTQQGKARYWFGKQGSTQFHARAPGNPEAGIELWDCVSLGIAAYERAGCYPVPQHLDDWVSVQPQELYDFMDNFEPWSLHRAFNIKVESPVNLHLYDSQNRHVGFTPSGAFERDIPNAYYYLEVEQDPQAIFVQNANDEYTLVIQAVDSGSFNLKIQDLNVSRSDYLTKVEFLDVPITESTIATIPLGTDHKDYRMNIDQDDDGKTDQVLDPTSLKVSFIDSWDGIMSGLTFESRSKPAGSSIQIPLTLNGVNENIGNMDMTLSYDPSVLEATKVTKGGLTTDSLFDYNIMDGTIKISLADREGFSGDCSIAYVNFDVIGAEGSSSPLGIVSITANRADDYQTVVIQTWNGLFTVINIEEGMGDGDGDGTYTALDALYALQMSVSKIPLDPVMDVNKDGSVSSIDARIILKNAVGGE
ncbi:cohesin domain-containing protein [Methanolobus sp. WCC4]|uniref:cohesin domain-containing protein n=1 Tax=Methanolobus sp. WCC4 TaxID=3125784 RepID=UPI0030F52F18